jgi:hypothetical protein
MAMHIRQLLDELAIVNAPNAPVVYYIAHREWLALLQEEGFEELFDGDPRPRIRYHGAMIVPDPKLKDGEIVPLTNADIPSVLPEWV